MKKLILSPSYFTVPLLLLLFIDKEYASYFYPYVASCSIIGIFIMILLLFNEYTKVLWKKYFPSNIVHYFTGIYQKIVIISIIITKLIVIKYWPYNISCNSILISLLYLFLYFIYYLTL